MTRAFPLLSGLPRISMTNITAENSGIRARFKNVLDVQQCKHLIRQNERGNIEHSKAANDPKNLRGNGMAAWARVGRPSSGPLFSARGTAGRERSNICAPT